MKLFLFYYFFLLFFLCGCSSEKKEVYTTSGVILEILPQTILVEHKDGGQSYLDYATSSEVFINNKKASLEELSIGDEIIISYYAGPILETDPAQIQGVTKIELFE